MRRAERLDIAVAFLSSARFVTVLTAASVGVAVLAFPVRQLVGWAGLIGVLVALVALWGVILVMRRGEIEWSGLLPVSLLAFVAWACVSVFWSGYQWASLGSVAYFVAFTVLAVAVALLRDTIQVVRAFGDVLRFTLACSLVVEIVAGLLIDSPIRFLGVMGDLDRFGPIQGILGSRNEVGIVAMVALVTFATEVRTRSVSRLVGVISVVLAALCLLLSRSPVALGAAVLVGVATLALFGLRRVPADRRRFWQLGLLGVSLVSVVVAWSFRSQIVGLLDATSELDYRLALWRGVRGLAASRPLEGWGWVGLWRDQLAPFTGFQLLPGGVPGSAANAYMDVWFQLGLVGVALFLVLLLLAFVRSWLLAVSRRSVVFVWPALVVLALAVTALAESSILVEFGWLTLVVCTVKASRELSWRQAFASEPATPDLPHER